MITIPLDTLALGTARFTIDPLWEMTAGLVTYYQPCTQRSWLHQSFIRAFPADALARHTGGVLAAALSRPDFVPDLLTPVPSEPWSGTAGAARERIAQLNDAELAVAEEDLAALAEGPAAAAFTGWTPARLRAALAEAALRCWDDVMEPRWARLTALLEADIAHRADAAARHGVMAALADLDPRITPHPGRIEVDLPPDTWAAANVPLWLIPSVLAYPGVVASWTGAANVICYGARGAGRMWEEAGETPDALSALIGRSRAGVLVVLDVPRTTTDLAAGQGLAPATVSEHLRALAGAGLVVSRREGRRVLYARTDLGDRLIGADAGCG